MAPLDKDMIAEAARYADAQLEELGNDLPAYCQHNLIELPGLTYVAEQRALRAAYTRDGRDPRKLPRERFSRLQLSRASAREMPLLAGTWMDGFVAGVQAERHRQGEA